MPFDPDIHHRRSIRLKGYDYTRAGAYFVSVCVHGREGLFGEIADGEMWLNEAGEMVEAIWRELAGRFPHAIPDEFIVMPDHVHGIIFLHDTENIRRRGESCIRPDFDHIRKNESAQNQGDHKDRPYGTSDFSLGRIVQAFKSLSTNAYIRGISENGWPPFPGRLWQRNYYERILRDEEELTATRAYIRDNPANWQEDEENPL